MEKTMTRTLAATAVSLTLLLLAGQPAQAQPRLSGYYEHTLQVDWPGEGEETLLDLSKLRLDIEAGRERGLVEFRANVNFNYYHSDISYTITQYLPDYVVTDLERREEALAALALPGSAPASLTTFTLQRARIWLDNAFLTWRSDHWRVRAGYQQLTWGPGYSINPTDLFHQKNPIDPAYEKEGTPALRLDYRWGIGGEASLIMAPSEQFREAGYALRVGTHIAPIGYDVALTAHSLVDSTSLESYLLEPPLPLPGSQPVELFRPRRQNRYALGLDFVGSLLGLGVWMEGNYNWMEQEEDFLRVVAGLDYTFLNGLYVMVEGLYNGRGPMETPYATRDYLENLYFGEPVGPGWVIAGASKDITALSTGSLYFFSSPVDGSLMVNPRFETSIAQNAQLSLFGAVTLGEDTGQFPAGLYSGFARMQVFF